MARKDMPTIDPYTYGGIDLSSDMNSWQTALETMHKGSGRPSYAAAGMVYWDDAADPVWTLYVYDGTNDIELFDVNTTTNTVIFDPAKLDVGAHANDEVLAVVGGVAAFAAISSIQIDPSTDFNSGLVPNANLNPAMRLGTDDSVQGSIYLYGDSATAGAVARFYNAASEDTTVEYFVFEANQHLYIGPNTDTDQLILKLAGGMQLTAGALEIGVSDSIQGLLYLYGAATNSGGTIRLYNADNEDTTYDYYTIIGDGSGLILGTSVANSVIFHGATYIFDALGNARLGDTTTSANRFMRISTAGTSSYVYLQFTGEGSSQGRDIGGIRSRTTAGNLALTEIMAAGNTPMSTLLPASGALFRIGRMASDQTDAVLFGSNSTATNYMRYVFAALDSASNEQEYGSIRLTLDDVTNGTEDSTLGFYTYIAGTSTLHLSMGAQRVEATGNIRAMSHAFAAPTTGKSLELHYDSASDSAYQFSIDRPSGTYKPLLIGASAIFLGGGLLGNGPVHLAINSSGGYVQFPTHTTTTRNALVMTGITNAIIWNSTTAQFERWNGSAWAAL